MDPEFGTMKCSELSNASQKSWTHAAPGVQHGVMSSKRALDPSIGYGIGDDEHFSGAQDLAGSNALPWNEPTTAEPDLRFAAATTVTQRANLREFRKDIQKAIKELRRRCKDLTVCITKHRPPHVYRVAGRVNVGFIAVLRFCCGLIGNYHGGS